MTVKKSTIQYVRGYMTWSCRCLLRSYVFQAVRGNWTAWFHVAHRNSRIHHFWMLGNQGSVQFVHHCVVLGLGLQLRRPGRARRRRRERATWYLSTSNHKRSSTYVRTVTILQRALILYLCQEFPGGTGALGTTVPCRGGRGRNGVGFCSRAVDHEFPSTPAIRTG